MAEKEVGLVSVSPLAVRCWLQTLERGLSNLKSWHTVTCCQGCWLQGEPQAKPEWHSSPKINCNLLLCNMLLSIWVPWKAVLVGLFQLLLESMRCGGGLSNLTLPKNCTCDSDYRLSPCASMSTSQEVKSNTKCKNVFIKQCGLSIPFLEEAAF